MKKYKKICLMLIIISMFGLITFLIDKKRIEKDLPPIFVIQIAQYKDGGSKEYLGFGYKIIKYHKIGFEEVVKDNYEIKFIFAKYDE